ncbi:hypothetical protein FLAVO9AF_230035 [Flavobacterium sp. 9AF]|nr:hypothetical protein FLAVO9AF_230035 [Flavobacterium sp. 9AF]
MFLCSETKQKSIENILIRNEFLNEACFNSDMFIINNKYGSTT